MKLNTNLTRLTDFEVCYAGWDKNSPNFSNGPHKAIHHPAGALKKIASGSNDLELYGAKNKYFGVWLDDGVTQGGSSGSPLFNADHKVVAHLSGGVNWTNCPPDSYQRYGRFELSWIDGGFGHYLDPNNSGVSTLNTYCPLVPEPIYADPPVITSGGNSCRHDLGENAMRINSNTNLGGIACADLPFQLSPYKPLGWNCEENPPIWQLRRTMKSFKCSNIPTWINTSSCTSRPFPFQGNCDCYYYRYYIEITEIDASLNSIGSSYGHWFAIQNPNWLWGPEFIEVTAGDIDSIGITLEQSKYYKIKLATSKYGWKEQTRVFRYCGEDDLEISGNIESNRCTRTDLRIENASISQNATISAGNTVEMNANTTLSYGVLEIFNPDCNNNTSYPLNKMSNQSQIHNLKPNPQSNVLRGEPFLKIFPNPASEELTISIASSDKTRLMYKIEIHDVLGRVIKTYPNGAGSEYRINISKLSAGTYFINLETIRGEKMSSLFIKQ